MTKSDLQFLAKFQPSKKYQRSIPVMSQAAWSTRGEIRVDDRDGTTAIITTDQIPAQETVLNLSYAATIAKAKSVFETQGDTLYVDGVPVPSENFSYRDYPAFPDYGTAIARVTFDPEELISALSNTLLTISTDDLRPTLMGVCFDFTERDRYVLVSTDTHRLTIAPTHPDIEEYGQELKEQFVLHGETLQKLLPFLKEVKGAVLFTFTESAAVISFENKTVVIKYMDGMYPPYRRVLPEEAGTKIFFPRDVLIERITTFLDIAKLNGPLKGQTRRVTLIPSKDPTSSEVQMIGQLEASYGTSVIKVHPMGSIEVGSPIPFAIALNGQYFLDALKQFNPLAEVVIEFHKDGPLRPVKVIHPDSEVTALVMPMQVL